MNERVFRDLSRTGVFRLSKGLMDLAAAAAGKAGLIVLEADVADCSDCDCVLNELGPAWNFPEWYGANLDALHDCLTDPDWQPAGSGHALLIFGLERLRAAHPDDFRTLAEVFRSAVELLREEGTPLWVVLDTAAPDIPLLPDA